MMQTGTFHVEFGVRAASVDIQVREAITREITLTCTVFAMRTGVVSIYRHRRSMRDFARTFGYRLTIIQINQRPLCCVVKRFRTQICQLLIHNRQNVHQCWRFQHPGSSSSLSSRSSSSLQRRNKA
uniref:Uncharacterized protein n=1 Tax=Mesocestoides corti TaxID=53468 RepID=A0A5K3G101_MESCO